MGVSDAIIQLFEGVVSAREIFGPAPDFDENAFDTLLDHHSGRKALR
jgi:hypothetical protein